MVQRKYSYNIRDYKKKLNHTFQTLPIHFGDNEYIIIVSLFFNVGVDNFKSRWDARMKYHTATHFFSFNLYFPTPIYDLNTALLLDNIHFKRSFTQFHILHNLYFLLSLFRSQMLRGKQPLSYRHLFHAGNHGDVLKHSILSLLVSVHVYIQINITEYYLTIFTYI